MKIRTKITLLFTVLVTAILLLLSFSIFYVTANDRANVFKNRLNSRATYNYQVYSLVGHNDKAALSRFNATSTLVFPRYSIGIFDSLGNKLYGYQSDDSDPPGLSPELIHQVTAHGEKFYNENQNETLAIYARDLGKPQIILVSGYDYDGWQRLKRLKNLLIISMIFGIIIALITGYIFSNQLLVPIGNMIREVNLITSQNLSSTINVGKSRDEMNLLANTFNNLLNRLQDAFSTQRRFISNASHELSTPLTSISSQLQVALQRERNVGEYRQVIQSVHEDVQHMLQLTRSLLEIAKTGTQGNLELKEVRVDELLLKVVSDVHKISPEYKVELDFEEFPEDDQNVLVFGNSELLGISFKNIIENGCKFSPDHTCYVDLSFHSGQIRVSIRNMGSIIPPQDHDNIFQPFYRSDKVVQVPGFGLGLPLSRRIINLHRGSISLESSREKGTIFIVYLPSLALQK